MRPEAEVLDDLVERILSVVQATKIILFGSAARGQMGPWSDLDVLVVVPDGTDRLATSRSVYRRLIGLRTAADIVVATEGDLERYGDNFSLVYYPALREGKVIYAA